MTFSWSKQLLNDFMEWSWQHWCSWWWLRGQSDANWLRWNCYCVHTSGTLPWKQTHYLLHYCSCTLKKQQKGGIMLSCRSDSSHFRSTGGQPRGFQLKRVYRPPPFSNSIHLFIFGNFLRVCSGAAETGDVSTQQCAFTAGPTGALCNYFSLLCHLHRRLFVT